MDYYYGNHHHHSFGNVPIQSLIAPRRAPISIATVFALTILAGCDGSGGATGTSGADRLQYNYTVPADIGDGWQVADLADEGMDTQKITDMMGGVLNEDYANVDSVAIVRNNKLLLYWYANRSLDQHDALISNTDNERHILHSSSKSFISALVGIAIDQQYIMSTQVSFYDLFNYASIDNPDPRKGDVTLEDALTMRLGLTWDEWSSPYGSQSNSLTALQAGGSDWSKALLDLPMAHNPGTVFAYNTAASIAIGQAVENATGMPLGVFANTFLFQPMQISSAAWWRTPTGLPNGGSGLFLNTRGFAKFGQLYLNGGSWRGQQLINADWIADTIVRRVNLSAISEYSEGYGFQWWLDDFTHKGQTIEAWTTSGLGGQFMFVVPSLDLVVAFTGSNYDDFSIIDNLYAMMRLYVLSAIDP